MDIDIFVADYGNIAHSRGPSMLMNYYAQDTRGGGQAPLSTRRQLINSFYGMTIVSLQREFLR